jgi:hypothetical protein
LGEENHRNDRAEKACHAWRAVGYFTVASMIMRLIRPEMRATASRVD